jgi:hypothetical protein
MQRKSVTLNPAQYIVKIFGGVEPAARALGFSSQRIYGWLRPHERRGCGGRIPSRVQCDVLERAKNLGLDLTESDLIRGRSIELES